MNSVNLLGRLTSDPELRQTPSGISTCSFTVAVNRSYTNENGERQADFISVVAWRSTADFISKYFSKGKMIGITGTLRTRTYDDKRYPDVRHYVTEVYADQVYFGGDSKSADRSSSAPAPRQEQKPANVNVNADLSDFEEVVSDSELPF